MDKHFNDKAVIVNRTGITRDMYWGELYSLYVDKKDDSRFYIDYMDGSEQVDFLGCFDSIEEAEKKAQEYWDSVEGSSLAFELKETREELGLSMTEMAKKFDIPYRTYQNWENGVRNPAVYVVKMIKRIVELEEE